MNPPELADPSPPGRAVPIACAPPDRAGRLASRILWVAATVALLLLVLTIGVYLLRHA